MDGTMPGTGTRTQRRPRHRGNGQAEAKKAEPGVIKLDELGDSVVRHLVSLCRSQRTATAEFTEALKSVASKSGLRAPTLRGFISAKSGDRFAERKEAAEQLSLLFDRIGE